MSEDRIYAALMDIKEKLGGLEAAQNSTDKKIDGIDARLSAIECKPAKRVEGGIVTAINTFVAAAVAAVISIFTKGS